MMKKIMILFLCLILLFPFATISAEQQYYKITEEKNNSVDRDGSYIDLRIRGVHCFSAGNQKLVMFWIKEFGTDNVLAPFTSDIYINNEKIGTKTHYISMQQNSYWRLCFKLIQSPESFPFTVSVHVDAENIYDEPDEKNNWDSNEIYGACSTAQNPQESNQDNLNLNAEIEPFRKAFPHIYTLLVNAQFNYGYNKENGEYDGGDTLTFQVIRLADGEIIHTEDIEMDALPGANVGKGGIVDHTCYSGIRQYISLYEAKIILNVDDSNPSDNEASCYFLVLEYI